VTGDLAAAWAASRYISVGPASVRYREAGAGPPLVLVHGLGVSADYWFRNAGILATAGLRVLAPDLPGFGRTFAPNAEAAEGPVPQADALASWADAMELGPSVYVGHSLSCQSILELAAHRPEQVRGLVLAAPTGSGPVWRRIRQLGRLVLDVPREPIRLVTAVGASYLRAGPLRVLRTWWQGARHDPLPLAARVAAPGLVIVGTRDPVVDPVLAMALAARLRHGPVHWIEGGTHAVHHSRAEAFNRAVEGFARALDPHPG
jgi:2-hydroxy-6-oxonona-2,4-dienedioate hydrolase